MYHRACFEFTLLDYQAPVFVCLFARTVALYMSGSPRTRASLGMSAGKTTAITSISSTSSNSHGSGSSSSRAIVVVVVVVVIVIVGSSRK